ncbi:MAG: PilT protein domain protein [Gemmatimonadetes bacterium]|nr:PilT protein domain protein [Gemmatimonadota bacterium]
MRLLLDTHTLVWALADPSRLSVRARAAVMNPSADVYVSMVSAWELAILQGLGRVHLRTSLESVFSEGLAAIRARLLPIQLRHVVTLGALPHYHRDPFDRLLLATAVGERLALVSRDGAFAQYGVSVVW